jgi:predicted nucleotidyltransferase/HEPN domain-containing protein
MNTALGHLPENKQAELKAIVGAVIPKFSEIEMIILFGSYARGNWVEDSFVEKGITHVYKSDYDLLIILHKNAHANSDPLIEKITDKIEELNLPTPVTPIFHSIEFVKQALNEGSYFFGDIQEYGIVLFNTGRNELTAKRELSSEEAKAKAERDFNNWFQTANRFLETFEFNLSKNYLNEAAFQLHQAAERYYNTIQLVFTGYKSRTHNIEILGKIANSCDMKFSAVFPRVTLHEKNRFKLLKKAYTEARYNMDFKVSEQDLEYLSARVELLKKLTAEICQERINSFAST